MAMGGKSEPVRDLVPVLFLEPAALRAGLAGGADGAPVLNENLEILHTEASFFLWRRLRRANELGEPVFKARSSILFSDFHGQEVACR
jgi:hypothetical protein